MNDIEFSYAGFHASTRPTPLHRHNGTELVLVAEGSCENRIPFRDVVTGPGDLLVVPPELEHRQVDLGFVRTFYVVFECKGSSFRSDLRVINTHGDQFIRSWMEQLVQLYQGKMLDQCRLLLPTLLSHLGHLEGETGSSAEMPPGLAQAVSYITYNFDKELEVNRIAVHCGLSPSYFNALFHRHLHCSPSDYLRKLRMGHARQLLRNSRMTVAEVGEQCGYRNAYYFCRVFRKVHGCTPGDYRAIQRREYDVKFIQP